MGLISLGEERRKEGNGHQHDDTDVQYRASLAVREEKGGQVCHLEKGEG